MGGRRYSVTDDLVQLMEARIASLAEQTRALQAAIAALRGLPTPIIAAPGNVPGWDDAPRDADGPAWGHPKATRNADARQPGGPRNKSKMPQHICTKCNGRTAWDPCHLCGHAAPVIASLATLAPDPRGEEED